MSIVKIEANDASPGLPKMVIGTVRFGIRYQFPELPRRDCELVLTVY